MNKIQLIRRLLVSVLFITALVLCGCSEVKREYVFPNDVLAMRGETPQQIADGVRKAQEYFPEDKYGSVYLNEDGNLCYLLSEDQKENWLALGLESLEATAAYYTGKGRTFEYSDDFRSFTFMAGADDYYADSVGSAASAADSDVQTLSDRAMQEIRLYSGEILTLQFFREDGSNLELVTTVTDEDGAVLERITWP